MKKLLFMAAAAAVALSASPALAHVTVQPNEAITGAFSRFVVRVPNEQDNASTTKVVVEFPALAFVSFEDADGWDRRVREGEFAEPIDAFGNELSEGVLRATWSGGEIQPGEFAEFGFSAAMPTEETELAFRAFQTYSNGDIVEWTGPADADEPAARVAVYDLGLEEGGEIAAIAALSDEVESLNDHMADMMSSGSGEDAEGDDEDFDFGLVLGGAGLLVGLVAVAIATRKPRS